MAVKMLVFDYRESEKEFFRTHELENFDITFYTESLMMIQFLNSPGKIWIIRR